MCFHNVCVSVHACHGLSMEVIGQHRVSSFFPFSLGLWGSKSGWGAEWQAPLSAKTSYWLRKIIMMTIHLKSTMILVSYLTCYVWNVVSSVLGTCQKATFPVWDQVCTLRSQQAECMSTSGLHCNRFLVYITTQYVLIVLFFTEDDSSFPCSLYQSCFGYWSSFPLPFY